MTLRNVADQIRDEHDAYLLLEELRWHGKPVCPHCGHDKAYFLTPKGGTRGTGKPKPDGKRTQSVRRVWKCAKCRKQFSVLTGTIVHGTKVSLRTWLMVMVQMSSAENGISAREVERMHGVTPETAWFMLHRLRESMKRDPLAGLLSGTIVADETYIGGRPKNRHQQGRNRPGTSKGYAGESRGPAIREVAYGGSRAREAPPHPRGTRRAGQLATTARGRHPSDPRDRAAPR
ncbi:MAG TPA: IS1595 family transposase [Acidimicrobiales bacterium]|nr:IS1595 family transposase [Acidimicrobiales bacterium]